MADRPARDRALRRYETILDSLDDAVYAIEPDGSIAYVNDRYAEMKGVDRETLIGTDIYDWVTDETAAKAKRARAELADGDRDVGVIEYDFLTADGERFPVEMRFTKVKADGETLDRVGVIRDITDRKRREESLRRKNERLDEFARVVSHDLRNPLSVAEGRLDLLEGALRELREPPGAEGSVDSDDPADSDDETAALETHVEEIAHAHGRMRQLIDDLLLLARADDDVDDGEVVDLASLATDAWRNVATAEAILDVRTDRSLSGDRSRLERLAENLFRNAIEHGGEDVTVTVGDLENGFYVADDGPGIPPDDRERVFESGYTTTPEGTGFGLRIVEQVADAHGWDARVTDATEATDAAGDEADGDDSDEDTTERGGARFEFTGVTG
ncbi:PAS domain S-box protein [Halorubrum tibetense]|uniref:histidine kinase n=1 Tax=Halorubrum tibetense TaxID=175631 RepID=A0ABD5SC82_9EURY